MLPAQPGYQTSIGSGAGGKDALAFLTSRRSGARGYSRSIMMVEWRRQCISRVATRRCYLPKKSLERAMRIQCQVLGGVCLNISILHPLHRFIHPRIGRLQSRMRSSHVRSSADWVDGFYCSATSTQTCTHSSQVCVLSFGLSRTMQIS